MAWVTCQPPAARTLEGMREHVANANSGRVGQAGEQKEARRLRGAPRDGSARLLRSGSNSPDHGMHGRANHFVLE